MQVFLKKLVFDFLHNEMKKITSEVLEKNQYKISGFIYAIQLWALSYVNQLGTLFGDGDDEEKFTLCLRCIGITYYGIGNQCW